MSLQKLTQFVTLDNLNCSSCAQQDGSSMSFLLFLLEICSFQKHACFHGCLTFLAMFSSCKPNSIMKTPDFCLNDSALTRDKKIVLHFSSCYLKHNGFACINYFYKCLGDVYQLELLPCGYFAS